jgi:hypothetical protein
MTRLDRALTDLRALMLGIIADSWARAMGRAMLYGRDADACAQLEADYAAEARHVDVILAQQRAALVRICSADGSFVGRPAQRSYRTRAFIAGS